MISIRFTDEKKHRSSVVHYYYYSHYIIVSFGNNIIHFIILSLDNKRFNHDTMITVEVIFLEEGESINAGKCIFCENNIQTDLIVNIIF